MPEIIKNLTDKFLCDIRPKSSSQIFRDKHRTYLKLVVRPSGAKSFYYRAKKNGKDLKRKIGDVSTMSLATARLIADSQHSGFKNESQKGVSVPSSLKSLTVNCMFELYRENELKYRRTVAGRKHALEVAYNLHVKASLGHRVVAQLDRKEVRSFFRELEDKGYCAHNKAVSVLKAACNYVIDFEDAGLILNPFERIKKMPGVTRTRYLTHQEAGQLMKALEHASNQDVADIYRMALFTGARLTNVKTMEWQDINLSNAVWLIPATRTKTNQIYEIPLHPLAVSLLRKRQRNCLGNQFVFPSKQKSKYGYITGGDSVWKAAIKQAGLYHDSPNIRPRPHDLRRTFARWQIQSEADFSVVSKALCHTSLKHTMVYAYANIDQVRNSIVGAFDNLNVN